MSDSIKFDGIILSTTTSAGMGKLRVASNGLAWKQRTTGDVTSAMAEDVDKVVWLRVSNRFMVSLHFKNPDEREPMNFFGFAAKDLQELEKMLLPNYVERIREVSPSVKGWNWGDVSVSDEGLLRFTIDGIPAFEIPISLSATGTATDAKHEYALEMPLDGIGKSAHTMVDARFHVPSSTLLANIDTLAGPHFPTKKSGVRIAELGVLRHLTPRGNFDVGMDDIQLVLRGKTNTLLLPYKSVQAIMCLPKHDTAKVVFSLTLDPPLRQGRTNYPYVLVELSSDDSVDSSVTVNVVDSMSASAKERFSALGSEVVGSDVVVLGKLLSAATGVSLQHPASVDGVSSVNCGYKTNAGHLFLLKRSLYFIHQPPLLIPHTAIESIDVERRAASSSGSRSFGLKVVAGGAEYEFTGIPNEQLATLRAYFNNTNLRVSNLYDQRERQRQVLMEQERKAAAAGSGDEDSDSDFGGGGGGSGSGSDDDFDYNAARAEAGRPSSPKRLP